jgi:hypothetical protein
MSMGKFRGVLVAGAIVVAACAAATPAVADVPTAPKFGSSVHIFNPGMDQNVIQAEVNKISTAQVHNEFGSRRDAILFEPGTYGSADNPLIFQVGY